MENIQEISDQDIRDMQANYCPFGYLDIKSALETARQVNISDNELYDMATDLQEEFGSTEPIELNYVIYNYIQQEARDIFETNFETEVEFDFYSNYMDTNFNISNEDLNHLKNAKEEETQEFEALKQKSLSFKFLCDYYDL